MTQQSGGPGGPACEVLVGGRAGCGSRRGIVSTTLRTAVLRRLPSVFHATAGPSSSPPPPARCAARLRHPAPGAGTRHVRLRHGPVRRGRAEPPPRPPRAAADRRAAPGPRPAARGARAPARPAAPAARRGSRTAGDGADRGARRSAGTPEAQTCPSPAPAASAAGAGRPGGVDDQHSERDGSRRGQQPPPGPTAHPCHVVRARWSTCVRVAITRTRSGAPARCVVGGVGRRRPSRYRRGGPRARRAGPPPVRPTVGAALDDVRDAGGEPGRDPAGASRATPRVAPCSPGGSRPGRCYGAAARHWARPPLSAHAVARRGGPLVAPNSST